MARRNPESPARRSRRKRLRKLRDQIKGWQAGGEHLDWPVCDFPGCAEPRVTEECCYDHSIDGARVDTFLVNDGIIDWQAIDITRRGLRRVELTTVEYTIAVAYMLNDGLAPCEIEERTGLTVKPSNTRFRKIEEVQDALRRAA